MKRKDPGSWPSRESYLEELAARAKGRIVVCCLGAAARMWARICPQDSNLILNDYMGLPIPFALGIAVARPETSVIVLEGDGGLMMKMETLITAGAKAPPNLLVISFFNRTYDASGGQPLPTDQIDLEAFAQAANFPQTATVDSPKAFGAALNRMLDAGKLGFINLLTAPDYMTEARTPKEDKRPRPLENRTDFTRWVRENCP